MSSMLSGNRRRSAIGALRPEMLMCLGFLGLILVGGLLLSLSASAADGRSIGLGKGLFTATSAVCVTGLVVVDTGTTFSLFGQIVLLLLIQAGGLGFMVFATMAMVALGHRVTLRDRLLLRESMNTTTHSGLVKLILWYGMLALILEAAGAAVLATRFVPLFGWQRGVYLSIWHAVSAFCNAGFDLFGQYSSLTGMAGEPVVLLTIAALILLGGTGFAVISEVMSERFRWRRFSLHARLVLSVSACLTLIGTLYIALSEWNNPDTLGAMQGWGNKLTNAFFQSVTMRTAGFNSIDLAAMSDGTKFVSIVMMLIGANPASTGGGIKTTTVAVVLLSVGATILGREDVTVMGRRISGGLVRRSVAVAAVTLLVFLGGTLLLTITEDNKIAFLDLLFESASAIGTVGVSTAGTPQLSLASKLVLVPMMYLGRVGPLTLALALANMPGQGKTALRYPEESVTIG